jgi:hypothetical protein
MADKNYFQILNEINVTDKIEKKNNLSYLSWAFAWGELKKLHPDATYKIYETAEGIFYWNDGKTAWVKTGVTVNNIEHIEYLPVMDFKNKSIDIKAITSFEVNKAIQRSLTKAIARHGLGLYIYAGEDLPEENGEKLAGSQYDGGGAKAGGFKNAAEMKKIYAEKLEKLKAIDTVDKWLKAEKPISEFIENLAKADSQSAVCFQDEVDKKRKELGVDGDPLTDDWIPA